MQVIADKLCKRYLYDWIIKDLSRNFESESVTGVSGINGSGKSTLMKMLSGWLSPSKGSVMYRHQQETVSTADVHKYVSIVAPYTDLIQEYDLEEMYHFHTGFRELPSISDFAHFEEVVKLKGHNGKSLQYYSSGMKQRVQLALATLSKSPLLLLDEPTSYLDAENKAWFYQLLADHIDGKTVIISSNDEEDFQLCSDVLYL